MLPSRQLEQSLKVARGSFEEKMSKFMNILDVKWLEGMNRIVHKMKNF